MRARPSLPQLPQSWQRARLNARRVARELGSAGRRLADRLAYRPREVVVVALLAGGLSGGLAVERWRARYPATAERLETEPPRLGIAGAVVPTPRPGPRLTVPRCEAPRRSARPGRGPESAGAALRLDLNRATPGELARLAGISWGLAARIVAARDAVEPAGSGAPVAPRTRFTRLRRGEPPAPPVEAESAPTTASDPEPLDGASDAPPQ